jgi:hypothetical protein
MTVKFTALMLLATALPFPQAQAHTGSLQGAPINGYMYFMLGVGIVYFIFLLIRMQRRSNKLK